MTDDTIEPAVAPEIPDAAGSAPEPEAAPPGEREPLDLELVKRVLEAALLSAPEPLTVLQLKRLFAGELDVDSLRKILEELKAESTACADVRAEAWQRA